MKIKSYKEVETERTKGKKRYIQRVVEEREAKKEQQEALAELAKTNQELGLYDIPINTTK